MNEIDLHDSDEEMLAGIDTDKWLEAIINESDSDEESTNETAFTLP